MKKLLVIGALCFIFLGSPAVSLAQTLTISQLQAIVASLQAQLNALIAQLNLIQQQENNSKPIESIKRSVAVISPNGGENWEIGKEYSVSWNRPTDTISDQMWPKGYYLQIDLVEGPTPINLKTVSGSIYTNASQRVMVNSTGCYTDYCYEFKPGKYKIKITVYDGKPCLGLCAPGNYGKEVVSDTSDNYITVSGKSVSNPSITIASPNGGETYKVGQNIPINFSTNLTDKQTSGIAIQLYKKTNDTFGKMYVMDIARNWIAGSPYNWTIPSTVSTGDYFVYVAGEGLRNVDVKEVIDFSDSSFIINQNITPSLKASLQVTVLKGGIYCIKAPCEFPLTNATVKLYDNSKELKLIDTKTTSSGYAFFSNLNPGTYHIAAEASGYTWSDYIKVGLLSGQNAEIKTTLQLAPTSQLNTNPDLAAVLQSLKGVLSGLSGSLTP